MDYQIYFKYESLDGSFAKILCNSEDMVAIVTLDSKDSEFKDIKKSARHEAIHLLLGHLSDKASYRYIRKGEIEEAEEALVNKLYQLIKWEDIK